MAAATAGLPPEDWEHIFAGLQIGQEGRASLTYNLPTSKSSKKVTFQKLGERRDVPRVHYLCRHSSPPVHDSRQLP
eukprot:1775007-Amphidinium_carterae.1